MKSAGVLAIAMAIAGCGGAAGEPVKAPAVSPAPSSAPSVGDAIDGGAPPDASSPLPTIEALTARASSLAPGLNELTRGELTTEGSSAFPLFHDAPKDVCVRVAFVADPPVHVSLVAIRSRDVLADATQANDVALGSKGPVCIRRGDGIELAIDVDAKRSWTARYVAWSSLAPTNDP